MNVRFGVHTGLQHTSIPELQQLWRRIEELGFEWISIWDHFYAADASGDPHCLEATVAHAALASATSKVRCGSLVYSASYRHPAVIANAMATLDQLSGGRTVLGLGAGWLQVEYDAYGFPFGTPAERLRRLEESIQCIRGLLTDETTTFDGQYFQLRDARCEPKPLQRHLPIWVGGGGEKVTLRIVARHAEGWNVPFIGPEAWAAKNRVLDEHCERVGRDPAEIVRTVNVGLAFDESELHDQFGPIAEFVRPGVLMGSPQEMVDRIGAYTEAGASWVIVAVRAPFRVEALERFAAEVIGVMGDRATEQGSA
ncbi:MAG: TIGR03560 family F420-dependent LLM class oxidoreductase [Acidimicrobiales bacterium]|nr:TIGR03560 family F420-dependent LLM class oxidoreductase [Acidimicrobiales bacterium]